MKNLIFGLMLALPLSGCGDHKSGKVAELKAAEASASLVPQALVPPASMFRFLDNVIAKVVALNPGSETVSASDLQAINAADLQASAQDAQLDLSKIQSMTNFLSPEAKEKVSAYFSSHYPDLGASSNTKTLKKSDITAAYATFKKFFGLPASDLLNSKAVLEAKDFNPSKLEAGGMNLVGIDDIFLAALALGFVVFYIIPAVTLLIVLTVVFGPFLTPLFQLLELLILFAISFGGLI